MVSTHDCSPPLCSANFRRRLQLYMYQLCRSLAYLHSTGICHRDIKPQNLLVDPRSHVLKLCDFGSAKALIPGEPSVAYICSRYYRAPELIFGATEYTSAIDVWSSGCVAAELLLGHPLFPGDTGVDQLVEIIKVLGTPTKEEVMAMNPAYTEFKFPQIRPYPWSKIFRLRTPPAAIDFINCMLQYVPSKRVTALEACAHPFFDELRDPEVRAVTMCSVYVCVSAVCVRVFSSSAHVVVVIVYGVVRAVVQPRSPLLLAVCVWGAVAAAASLRVRSSVVLYNILFYFVVVFLLSLY